MASISALDPNFRYYHRRFRGIKLPIYEAWGQREALPSKPVVSGQVKTKVALKVKGIDAFGHMRVEFPDGRVVNVGQGDILIVNATINIE